jgi:hypothetical protein
MVRIVSFILNFGIEKSQIAASGFSSVPIWFVSWMRRVRLCQNFILSQ